MYCSACGAPMEETAKFCSACGSAVPSAISKSAPASFVEQCEVIVDGRKTVLLGPRVMFWAKAIGSEGAYNAGASSWVDLPGTRTWLSWLAGTPSLKKSPHRKLDAAFRALVQQLTAQGWEPTGRGATWYSLNFRRERPK